MKTDDEDIKKLPLKKADVILMASLCLLSLVLVLTGILNDNASSALMVRGYRNGELVFEYPIGSSVKTVISAPDGEGSNTVVIEDKKVRISAADCPGHDCVNKGTITKSGEEIICLPHKLVIRIEGGEGIDALTY